MKFALLHAYFHYRMGGTIYRNGGSVPTESRYHRAGQAVQLGPEYSVVSDLRRIGAVVLASSPRVKKEYNIKTGSRLFEIPKRSPIMIVEPNMALYLQRNRDIQNIFRRFVTDEDLHVYSIDESILDVTASLNLFGPAENIALKILKTVKDELRLIVTVGIGDNPLLAKQALDNEAKKRSPWIAKWTYEMVPQTVWKINPMTDFWGISRGYDKRLKSMGIYTIEALAHADPLALQKSMGVMGLQLYYHAWGLDASIIAQKVKPKSTSYNKRVIFIFSNPRKIKGFLGNKKDFTPTNANQ